MKQLDPEILRLLAHMVTLNASDLYLTAGSPPVYRKDGVGLAAKLPFSAENVDAVAASFMTAEQREEFAHKLEMNLAFATPEGRFRVNVYRQRGATGLVVRLVRSQIKTLDELGHPEALKSVVLSKRGLVLVVGGTGSGKSTTLAAMLDYRNTTETGHIVTVEDPIEYLHAHKRCVVSQREVGVDTLSYSEALKNTLRQAPDLVLIGEIRDLETMEAAIGFAETGHLCLSTLHANNANQALERVLSFFPSQRHQEISSQLSLNLRAIISQRLVPSTSGGRAAALEILLDTPRIKALIKRGETELIKDAMEQSVIDGCQTFDGALLALCRAGHISEEAALRGSDSPNNLRLLLERIGGGKAHPGEAPLRLVTSPEAQVRRQTMTLQAQKASPGAAPAKVPR